MNGRGAIRALVIASGPGTAPALTRAVELAPGIELAGEVDAMRALAGLRPACDAFLVVGDPTVVRELSAASPGIPAVLVGGDADGRHLRLAMSAGARGVVPAEPRPEELAASLLDAVGASAPAQERRRDGRVVAVCGAKGGVGATTVAVGIAAAASGMLVDAAAGHGTLAGHLGCHPQRSLADLARLAGWSRAEAVAAVRTEHPSGMACWPACRSLTWWGCCRGGWALRSPGNAGRWPHDGIRPREAGISVFHRDRAMYGRRPARADSDALAATAAAATIGTMVRRGVDPDAVALVVNRWRGGDALPLRAIEATAGARVLRVVREDTDGASRFGDSGAVPPVKRRGLGRISAASQIGSPVNADLAPLVAGYGELVREELLRRPWLDGDLRGAVEAVALDLIRRDRLPLAPGELERLTAAVADEAAGVGPLEALVRDPTVTEVIVNGPDRVYAEREGRLREEAVDSRTRRTCAMSSTASSAVGRRVDESSPMVDARLPDGSRVNAVLPPLAVDGPLLTIRKFSAAALSIADHGRLGSVRAAHAELLDRAVRGRLNVVISGGTGTGKTTLSMRWRRTSTPAERIVTVEDAAELRLPQPHVARLEARPSNIEGRGRSRPRPGAQRAADAARPIVVGECAGARRWTCSRR